MVIATSSKLDLLHAIEFAAPVLRQQDSDEQRAHLVRSLAEATSNLDAVKLEAETLDAKITEVHDSYLAEKHYKSIVQADMTKKHSDIEALQADVDWVKGCVSFAEGIQKPLKAGRALFPQWTPEPLDSRLYEIYVHSCSLCNKYDISFKFHLFCGPHGHLSYGEYCF